MTGGVTMPAWPALLLAPLLALAEQSIMYALSTPSCQTQRDAVLNVIPLAFLIATAVLTVFAFSAARRLRRGADDSPQADADALESRRYFVAWMAVGSGALSSLVILATWVPHWVLSPCAS
jgi:hypothetical protein